MCRSMSWHLRYQQRLQSNKPQSLVQLFTGTYRRSIHKLLPNSKYVLSLRVCSHFFYGKYFSCSPCTTRTSSSKSLRAFTMRSLFGMPQCWRSPILHLQHSLHRSPTKLQAGMYDTFGMPQQLGLHCRKMHRSLPWILWCRSSLQYY